MRLFYIFSIEKLPFKSSQLTLLWAHLQSNSLKLFSLAVQLKLRWLNICTIGLLSPYAKVISWKICKMTKINLNIMAIAKKIKIILFSVWSTYTLPF